MIANKPLLVDCAEDSDSGEEHNFFNDVFFILFYYYYYFLQQYTTYNTALTILTYNLRYLRY